MNESRCRSSGTQALRNSGTCAARPLASLGRQTDTKGQPNESPRPSRHPRPPRGRAPEAEARAGPGPRAGAGGRPVRVGCPLLYPRADRRPGRQVAHDRRPRGRGRGGRTRRRRHRPQSRPAAGPGAGEPVRPMRVLPDGAAEPVPERQVRLHPAHRRRHVHVHGGRAAPVPADPRRAVVGRGRHARAASGRRPHGEPRGRAAGRDGGGGGRRLDRPGMYGDGTRRRRRPHHRHRPARLPAEAGEETRRGRRRSTTRRPTPWRPSRR